MAIVSRPFNNTQALNALIAGPVCRISFCTGPSMYSLSPRMAPPSTRPWPSMCLVPEYTTTSTPSGTPCCSSGVAKTLSSTTFAPAAWASSVTAAMSTSDCIGFDGVSKNTAVVGTDNACSHWDRSSPSTKTVSTPQRGRISLHTTKHEPNRLRDATNRSPAPSSAPSDVNTAAMPLAVANAAGAPSSRRSRSSNIVTVGLPYRE